MGRRLILPPRKIQILGKRYEVTQDDDGLNDDDNLGDCTPYRCRIRYTKSQDEQRLRDTILHEVLHAIFYESGITMLMTSEEEEKIVRPAASTLISVLRENPKLVEYLTE